MNFRGHFYSAIAAIIIITVFALFHPQDTYLKYNLSTVQLLSISLIFILYSLVPDIDCDSNIQTIVYLGILFTEIWLLYSQKYMYAAFVGILSTIPIISKHRQLCHSWLFGIAISLPFALVNWIFVIPAFAGFALHKVCD
jgi:hypothetical protein